MKQHCCFFLKKHILLMLDDMFKIQCVQLKKLIIKSEVWL